MPSRRFTLKQENIAADVCARAIVATWKDKYFICTQESLALVLRAYLSKSFDKQWVADFQKRYESQSIAAVPIRHSHEAHK